MGSHPRAYHHCNLDVSKLSKHHPSSRNSDPLPLVCIDRVHSLDFLYLLRHLSPWFFPRRKRSVHEIKSFSLCLYLGWFRKSPFRFITQNRPSCTGLCMVWYHTTLAGHRPLSFGNSRNTDAWACNRYPAHSTWKFIR